MEAKTQRSKPAKPPESRREAKPADTRKDWRSRAAEEVEESQSGGNGLLESNVELPYQAVPPLNERQDLQQEVVEGQMNVDERAYRVKAPVQREGLGRAVADKVMGTEITLDIRDLAGLAPDVRENMRKDLTKSRRPVRPPNSKAVLVAQEPVMLPFEDEEKLSLEYDALELSELPSVSSVFVTTVEQEDIPRGSVMISDPYLQYLESLGPDEAPKQVYVDTRQVFVARDSAALRVVYPSINKQGRVESVMDSGSQIVSMSLEQAAMSKLLWDPDVQIFMQSANGSLEKSVGLARNVPFKFGDITVYLQVHIIRGPAYKVLLGRPFEILTECQINNNRDETQTVTLKDPNTGRRCMMTTYPRGKDSEHSRKPKATVESVPDEDDRPTQTADPAPKEQGFRQASMT